MSPRHYVCSDIHLGLPISQSSFFYERLVPGLREGDTLILLGDILDFWISAHEIQHETVLDNWKDLYDCLVGLKDRGVAVHYVPGNHDSFVFYTESGQVEDFEWSRWLFKICGTFERLYQETAKHRLAALCDIHYPFYRATLGGTKYLFTHGHWVEFMWKVLAGDVEKGRADRRLPKFSVVAKALMTCAVHAHASGIRRFFNRYLDNDDAFELTRRVEDVSYCILAETLAREPAGGAWSADPKQMPGSQDMGRLHEKLSSAIRTEFPEGQAPRAPAAPSRDRKACMERGKQLLERWLRADPPAEQVDRFKTLLLAQTGASNYTLRRTGGRTTATYQDLVTFADFDVLVFGHFHRPRFSNSAVDEGCMLQNPKNTTIKTYLVIEPNGLMNPTWLRP